MKVNLYVRFSTRYGQSLFVTGNVAELGSDVLPEAIPMQFFNEELWALSLDIPAGSGLVNYRYVLREAEGNEVVEWGDDRSLDLSDETVSEITSVDTWNHAGTPENAFYTKPFQDVLLAAPAKGKVRQIKNYTHEFRVKAPLLEPGEVLCISGSGKQLGEWNAESVVQMKREGNWWIARVNLLQDNLPIVYKYAVWQTQTDRLVRYEQGSNRLLIGDLAKGKRTILQDGFAQIGFKPWRGAGVAIPVFSLRSEKSYGAGEFTDIPLLADWANQIGLKLIQLLPVNDTSANNLYTDSYPYAAISAFALHPLYLNPAAIAGNGDQELVASWEEERQRLNQMEAVDYTAVMKLKWNAIRQLYEQHKKKFTRLESYKAFFEQNQHWLEPYALFCYLKDQYKTSDYNTWPQHSVYDPAKLKKLLAPTSKTYDQIAIHFYAQYHLHMQLKDATAYAHEKGIVVKGDLPIGIYRYSCDAWMEPALYNMDAQAGAPPDDFAIKGQNWGFPTYNWKQMQADGFAWWRRRFAQMSIYFDAFRIDHILGFFRIWSIPMHAVQGILGKFVPAIPVHISEFHQQHIYFDYHRYTQPYITEQLLQDQFGDQANYIKDLFLDWYDQQWHLKEAFNTQRKVEQHFSQSESTAHTDFLKNGLFDLISNVILIEEEGSNRQQFHFRISMESTRSFQELDGNTQRQLKELYVNYFFRRQDAFWKKEAMNKLPELKRTTSMLVCGEDLGMVPECVPDVMQQLGMLSLEIQRMPKDPKIEFFHPADAPYLSVVTPSTHDMSTIRGWWEEDAVKTQRFYNHVMGKYGSAPFFCEGWINREIVIQHLYSPAMWSIFQLQDLMGMDDQLRLENPASERINIPADPKHYWRYRMHLTLEQLQNVNSFNTQFADLVKLSGRS